MLKTLLHKIYRRLVGYFPSLLLSIFVLFVSAIPVHAHGITTGSKEEISKQIYKSAIKSQAGNTIFGSSELADFVESYQIEILIAALVIILLLVSALSYTIVIHIKNKNALYKLAYLDELTGVSNLNKFKIDAKNLLSKFQKDGYDIICFDIKDFKLINDMFGHKNGDQVLLNIVLAVRQNMVEGELFARISSDNFVMLVEHDDSQQLTEDKQKMLDSFEQLNSFNDTAYSIIFSAGAYSVRKGDDTSDIDALMDKALMAHKIAKHMVGSAFVFYDDKIRDQALASKEIENAMEGALANEEFRLYLQPKYRLSDEKIVGAEALVRWKTVDGKMILPDSFIPLFERNGFVLKLDMYMLKKACKKLRSWIDSGVEPVPISVNFSRNHFKDEFFVRNVIAIVKKYSIPPNLIEIELTESTLFSNDDSMLDVMGELHREGVTLSMDDFGIGYSSLGLLKNLPVDVIKIDKSFFDKTSDNERATAVVTSVIEMAKRLNIRTVAEGIETKENVDLLKALSCDTVQGYYYARPMPTEDFDKLMGE